MRLINKKEYLKHLKRKHGATQCSPIRQKSFDINARPIGHRSCWHGSPDTYGNLTKPPAVGFRTQEILKSSSPFDRDTFLTKQIYTLIRFNLCRKLT